MPQWRGRPKRDREWTIAQAEGPLQRRSPGREAHQAARTALPRTWATFPGPSLPMFRSANRRPARRQIGPRRSPPARRRNLAVTIWRSAVAMNSIRSEPIGASLTLEFTMAMPISSACDYYFLIEAAEERFLADASAAAGKPFGDFVTPQIEREWFEFGQQRSPNITQRMPPSRQVVIHDDDLSAWFHDAKELDERLLAISAGLLVQ